MFAQVVSVLSRLLLFRAGPQDFPFSPVAARGSWLAAVAAIALMWSFAAGPGLALALGLVTVGGMALVTRLLLRARRLDNRFQQTLTALACTAALHALLLVPLLAQVAPEVIKALQDPVLMEKMRAGEPVVLPVPAWASVMSDLVVVWNFAVTAWIFRHAGDLRWPLAILFSIFYYASVFFFVLVVGSFAAALLGAGAGPGPAAGA